MTEHQNNSSFQKSNTISNSSNIIIAIGASTGGTESVLKVLKQFPKNSPPILIVQHMPAVFTTMYAERLNSLCHVNVKEASHKDIVKAGWAYLAPGELQMRLVKEQNHLVLNCHNGEKVSGHKPSVDALFSSVAKVAKQNAIGVIMTGMGKDGARGLLEMKQTGAFTIGENQESCVVYGMPMEAKKIGAVIREVHLDCIFNTIQNQLNKKK